ncbi:MULTISPECIES: hypothetical protein [Agrobacterium]|jgi:hypothetical protein|uniref:hypothetical protein n=1 Tax=Agrobacterium TaxID=357 RepID=UPI000B21392E|nr:hypothetical protein [Agrobacterium tumefaciens]
MPVSIRRELKQNVGDGLRGLRYLVHILGSDAERPKIAPPVLPDALPEIDNLMGVAFRAVGNVMCLVETAGTPLRQTPAGFHGFASLQSYFAPEGLQLFCDDLYEGLKAIAAEQNPSQLILKSRLPDIYRTLHIQYSAASSPEKLCAGLLLSLVKFSPLVDVGGREADLLRQYITLTLLFGISVTGQISREEVKLVVRDALLLAGTRMELVSEAVLAGSDNDLAVIFSKLIKQLA